MDKASSVYDDKILRDFAAPEVDKKDVFHTSVYAATQDGAKVGSGGAMGMDVRQRQALDENRKYVRNYRDARLMSGLYAQRKTASVSAGVKSAAGAVSGEAAKSVQDAAAAASAASLARRQATEAAVSGYEARLNTHVSKQGYGQDCRRGAKRESLENGSRGFNSNNAPRPVAPPAGGGASRFQVKPNIKPSW